VHAASDAAVPVVERLRARYPAVASRLIVTGQPPYPNAKVYSLDRMLESARYDLIVMADSDVRVTGGMLAAMAAEFADGGLALRPAHTARFPEGVSGPRSRRWG